MVINNKTTREMEMEMEMEMPIGYRFQPTDEELIKYYLTNKVLCRPLPAEFIQEIDARQLYSKPPMNLVKDPFGEREWYFFIHQDEYFYGERKKIQVVGNGVGFWRSIGEEDPIYNSSEGDVSAFKIYFTYFSGSLPNAKRTHWRMEEYRLSFKCNTVLERDEWVLGRLKRGKDYSSCF